MGPTDIIREWLEGETVEVQSDVGFLTLTQLVDDYALPDESADAAKQLSKWLTPAGESRFRSVGKAISFVAVFEKTFAHRFAAAGWDRPRSLFERAISEAPSDSMVATATTALADLPRKQALWAEVGERWRAVEARLTPEFLEDWQFERA